MISEAGVALRARLAAIPAVALRATAGRARLLRLAALTASGLLAFGAVALGGVQPSQAIGYTPITGSGSTWVYPAMNNWIQDVKQFQITVNYSASGSTQGRNDFRSGVADFGASEIPYGVQDGTSFDPPPSRGYAYIPDAAGGTTFMYNLHINGQRVTDLRLSGKAIAGIFTNKITVWNDPVIKADNPGLTLPPTPIIPVVRSDGAGSTADFTQWMIATQPSYWTAYCAVVGRSPCTQTSSYPVQSGTAMVGVPADAGVAGYVSQAGNNGAIGYVEYSYALATGFPVAKVLNAAGYYTEPTPGHVAVSLLAAQLNTNQSSPLYLTEDLSRVYNDPDPRTYELSAYSYMIIPTDLTNNMTTGKGYTLGAFGQFLLCVGQSQVDPLGYSALPINLVERGFAQLRRIPGSQVPSTDLAAIAQCHNPTFSTNGTNTLAVNDPQPAACDKQGPTQCTTATGGAGGGGGGTGGGGGGGGGGTGGGGGGGGGTGGGTGGGGGGTGGGGGGTGGGGTGGGGTGGGGGGGTGGGNTGTGGGNAGSGGGNAGNGTPTSGSSSAAASGQNCDPNTGICTPAGGSTAATGAGAGAGTGGSSGTGTGGTSTGTGTGTGQPQSVPITLSSTNGDGNQVMLMTLAALLFFCIGVVPPLFAQSSRRRRQRLGIDEYYDEDRPGDYR